ncbi:hypothetical protein H4219_005730 [Mycoemilia scoparia]|uniref:RING-type domain-containing protein n=1 Tax=Mycoemilia scoparia TaxID=417184 RepID=A0A9W7ZLP1_9FUNG|nr:hypothetical protein H4219_005730 [Mycoemilia scoparia]
MASIHRFSSGNRNAIGGGSRANNVIQVVGFGNRPGQNSHHNNLHNHHTHRHNHHQNDHTPGFLGTGVIVSGDFSDDPNIIGDIITRQMNAYDGSGGPPPASQDSINRLPRRKVNPEDVAKNAKCPVCLAELESGETVLEMPCKHLVHSDCGAEWFKEHGTCPIW